MKQYYWKDDSIHTNKQRAMEIKKVMQSTAFGAVKLQPLLSQKNATKSSIAPAEDTSELAKS